MRRFALAVLAACLALPARADQLPAADFMNLPLDVRAQGMGEAAAAVARGAGEAAVNPAALTSVEVGDAYFTHAFLHSGAGSDYVSLAGAMGRHHLGLSFQHVGYGTFQGIDNAGNATANFGPTDNVWGLSYATALFGADLGATLKFVDSRIVSRATALTWDLGAQYKLGDRWFLGLAGQNLGGDLNFDGQNAPLPTRVAIGGGVKAVDDWLITLDVMAPTYTPAYVAIGTEYSIKVAGVGTFALRAGGNTRTPDLGPFSGIKFGLGYRMKAFDLDYSFDPAGDLGTMHHLGAGYRFGGKGL